MHNTFVSHFHQLCVTAFTMYEWAMWIKSSFAVYVIRYVMI